MEPEFYDILTENGKDPIFAVKKVKVEFLVDPLWIIVWRENGEQVPKTGGFMNQASAQAYAIDNKTQLIDKEFEKNFLVNE